MTPTATLLWPLGYGYLIKFNYSLFINIDNLVVTNMISQRPGDFVEGAARSIVIARRSTVQRHR